MSNPKRVRDSKKRAVRQGKEQVWLVDWEKVVNTNHWFAEATWTDVVYDWSWEAPQEPLQTYDGWWGEDVPSGSSITINRALSQTSGVVGSQIRIYVQCDNPYTMWWSMDVVEADSVIHETWDGYNTIAVYNVVGEGETTITIQDNVTWDADSIGFTWLPAPTPEPYTVNENTIAYFPFKNDIEDLSENDLWYLIWTEDYTVDTYWIRFWSTAWNVFQYNNAWIKFASIWYKIDGPISTTENSENLLYYQHFWEISYNMYHVQSQYNNKIAYWKWANWTNPEIIDWASDWWHHLAWGVDSESNDFLIVLDGEVNRFTSQWYNFWNNFKLFRSLSTATIVSDFILENQWWSEDKILEYYNATKTRYPIAYYTLQFEVNSDTLWTVSRQTFTISQFATITKNFNTLDISDIDGDYSVMATPEQWCLFFTWFGVPTKPQNATIMASFYVEWTNPSVTYAYASASNVSESIGVPFFNIKKIKFLWTTWDIGTWSNIDFRIGNMLQENYLLERIPLWSNATSYNTAYSTELYILGTKNVVDTVADLWLWRTPSRFSVEIDSSSIEVLYGENWHSHQIDANYKNAIEAIFASENALSFSIGTTSATFNNVNVTIEYERQTNQSDQ